MFNDNLFDEMKYHWIDYLMSFPSDRLDSPVIRLKMLIMSSNEHFRQYNAQLMKFQVLQFILGIKKKKKKKNENNFFSLLDVKRF